MKKVKYPKGTQIIKEDSDGDEIFFITSGKVSVFKTIDNNKVALGELGEKSFFGEMSMFLESKRTASVEAIEDTEVIVGNKKEFVAAIKEKPEKAIHIIATMAKRLAAAHEIISEQTGQLKGFEILLTPFE